MVCSNKKNKSILDILLTFINHKGTPEFMAPEYYNEIYTTSVDIWAFGMAMIEMVTLKRPYSECDNIGQIFKKVSGGVRPLQLDMILDLEVKSFIKLCLADEHERPTAAQLLEHSFFKSGGNDSKPVQVGKYLKQITNDHLLITFKKGSPDDIKIMKNPILLQRMDTPDHLPMVGEGIRYTPKATPVQNKKTEEKTSQPNSTTSSPTKKDNNNKTTQQQNKKCHNQTEESEISEDSGSEQVSMVNTFDMRVVDRQGNILDIVAQMGIETNQTKESSEIEFSYNLAQDDPCTTASEMVKSLELDSKSHRLICSAFEELRK